MLRRAVSRAWSIEPAWPISLGLAAAALSGHWDEVGVPPVDRLLIFGGLGLAVLRAGSVPELPPLRFHRIHLLLLAVLCFGLASAFWVGTLDDHSGRFALIDQLGLVPFAAYLIAPSAFSTPHQRDILLGVLVALGLYLGATAILEAVGADALLWPRYIADPEFGIHADRARGPFVQAEFNGLAMVFCGVAAAVAAGRWRDRVGRTLAWAVMGLCAAGILLTYTRQIWIGAGAGVLLAFAVFPQLRWRLVPTLAAGAGAVALAIVLVPGLERDLTDRYNDSKPVWTRETTNQAALHMIAQRPVLGWGWETYGAYSADHVRTIDDIPISGVGEEVHNVFLARAVDMGLVGGGLWLIALLLALGPPLVRPLGDDRERWRRGFPVLLVAMFVAGMLSPLSALFPMLALWLWAGLLGAEPFAFSARADRRPALPARPALAGSPGASPVA